MKFNKFVLAAMVASVAADAEADKAAAAAADLAACKGVTWESYAKKDCAETKTDVAADAVPDQLKCKGADPDFYKAACTDTGIKYSYFKKDGCADADADTTKDIEGKYGECYNVGEVSFKITKAAADKTSDDTSKDDSSKDDTKTGALALKASAVVLAAYVGMQF